MTSSSAGSRRGRGQRHGDLRAALEEAALELVAERGPNGFSLAGASRRAGVSVAAPYNHFADREDLLSTLTERGYRLQRDALTASMPDGPAAEQLAGFATAYIDFAASHQGLFLLTSSGDALKRDHPELREAGDAVFALLMVPARTVRDSDEGARELCYTAGAIAYGFASLLLNGAFHAQPDPLGFARDAAAAAVRAVI